MDLKITAFKIIPKENNYLGIYLIKVKQSLHTGKYKTLPIEFKESK